MYILSRYRLERKRPPHHHRRRRTALARVTTRHAQELAQRDVRPPWIIELAVRRECFGQKFRREHLRVEPIGDFVVELLQHDSARDAGVSLAGGRHVWIGIATRASEILLEHEITIPHDEEPALLRAAPGDVPCLLARERIYTR